MTTTINASRTEPIRSDLLRGWGGAPRKDPPGVRYLRDEFGLEQQPALQQVAERENDYGVDGFHYDRERRNLYLFQFKCSDSYTEFKRSMGRLIQSGMEKVFGNRTPDASRDQLLLQLKSCLAENEAAIDRICIHLIFAGDPAEAERSQVLDKLREDLENKKHLIDHRFGRAVTLVIEFRSGRTRKVGGVAHLHKTHVYPLKLGDSVTRTGPSGELMTIGFVRLLDLYSMYKDMGERFFERNVRAALPDDMAVNRSIQRSIRRIVVDKKESAAVFGFNHNGVTLFAEKLVKQDEVMKITEPRLLNGAQTVTTFARFLKGNGEHRLNERRSELEQMCVMCRIVSGASKEFVTTVAINNNRQNPVEPWNLRANDLIQLELQDKLRTDLGLYYERQERAFENLSDEELEDQGISGHSAIQLTKLTKTFLVTDGELDKVGHFREVFEDDRIYAQVFNAGRLKADSRHIMLCYKSQFRLRRLVKEIVESGANKYAYVHRSRNLLWALLCQSILNDPKLSTYAESFGRELSLEAQYSEWLSSLAATRCRLILSDLVADKMYAPKVEEGNFGFMRTNAAYKRAMEIAQEKWRWVEKRLCRQPSAAHEARATCAAR